LRQVSGCEQGLLVEFVDFVIELFERGTKGPWQSVVLRET
jgi:hypothetical protein